MKPGIMVQGAANRAQRNGSSCASYPLAGWDNMSNENKKKNLLAVRPGEDTEEVIPRLQERKWNVDIAQSLEASMASLADGEYDALLIDNSTTPDPDGFLKAMRQVFPELKVIVTGNTGASRPATREAHAVPEEPGSLPDKEDAVEPRQGRGGETGTRYHYQLPSEADDSSGTPESVIGAASRWTRAVLWPQELYSAIVEQFHRISGAPWVSFFLKDTGEGYRLRLAGCRGLPLDRPKHEELKDASDIRQLVSRDGGPPSVGPVPWALGRAQHCLLDSARCLSVPLRTDDEVVGVMYLAVRAGEARYRESQVHMFSALAREAADLLQLSQRVSELRQDSLTDGLTGLYNRKFFEEKLEREIGRARRSGRALALAILDIDHFKDYNDLYGHRAGDRALQRIAQIMQEEVRGSDTVCRYGGEEFAIILPDTSSGIPLDKDQGLKIVDRVRQAVREHTFEPSHHLTLSAGLGFFREDADDADGMVRHADQMLYRAKRAGRNRVLTADDPG